MGGSSSLTVTEGVKVVDGVLNIRLHLKRNAELILETLQDNPSYKKLLKNKSLFDNINIEGTECSVIKYLISVYDSGYSGDKSVSDLLRLHNSINNSDKFAVEITGFLRESLADPDRDGNDMLQLVGFKIINNTTGTNTFLRMEQRYKNVGLQLEIPGSEMKLYGLQKSASSGTSTLTSKRCTDIAQVQEEGLRRYKESLASFRAGPSSIA